VFECAFYSRFKDVMNASSSERSIWNGLDAFTLEPNQFIFVKQEAVTDPDRS